MQRPLGPLSLHLVRNDDVNQGGYDHDDDQGEGEDDDDEPLF